MHWPGPIPAGALPIMTLNARVARWLYENSTGPMATRGLRAATVMVEVHLARFRWNSMELAKTTDGDEVCCWIGIRESKVETSGKVAGEGRSMSLMRLILAVVFAAVSRAQMPVRPGPSRRWGPRWSR